MENTKCQARNFLGTLNNPEVEPKDFLEKWVTQAKAKYVCGQLEKGADGTVHVQYFLNFAAPTRVSALKKYCQRSHFEQVKINNGAHSYCMKEDTRVDGPWEFGEKPIQRNNKTDWEEVKQNAKAGKLDSIPADIYVKHIFQLEHIAKMHQKIPPRTEEKQCLWLWGLPGCGKTRYASQNWPEAYQKLQNKWWDGYHGQEAVLLDDLGKEVAKALTTHMKLWADPWKNQPGEVKGGQVALTYNYFIVTSNYHPSDLYEGIDLEAIMRRFKITEMKPEYLEFHPGKVFNF